MDKTSYSIRKYFTVFRYIMTSTGTWPYQSEISAKVAQIFFVVQHVSIVIPEIIKLYQNTHDVDLVLESLPSIFYNTLIAVMFANMVYYKQKTKQVLELIHTDWENLVDENERGILTNYADVGAIMTLFYIGACYSTLLMFCGFPLTPIVLNYVMPLNESRPKMPLFKAEFFIDQDKYFYSILLHNIVISFVGMGAILNADIYLANVTQHICGMLTILGLMEVWNDMLRILFGLLLLMLVIMLSFTALVVLIKWGVWIEVLRFALFTNAELFHIFTYSFHSQMLISHNDKLFDAIQRSGWYYSSIRTRRLIHMMTLRCSKPVHIVCMLFPLSMENFTTIIKTSFSYLTVVQSTR